MFFGLLLVDSTSVKIPEAGFIGAAMEGNFTIPLVGSVEGLATNGTGELGFGRRDRTRPFM